MPFISQDCLLAEKLVLKKTTTNILSGLARRDAECIDQRKDYDLNTFTVCVPVCQTVLLT